ncbi:MAG: CoA ester lyase [Sphingorhabdus sp.]
MRSSLYVPGSNARALEKAIGLPADMLIIDLEDAVPDQAKPDARQAAASLVSNGVPNKILAIRINSVDSIWYQQDVAALQGSKVDLLVLPKVESAATIEQVWRDLGIAMLAMIETPSGIYAAREIARHQAVAGLIAGTNDIAAETGIRPGPAREGLELALQAIVLAASAVGKPRFDGVCNRLDDMEGFDAECSQGVMFGFTGKTLIHPNQVAIANRVFGPGAGEVAEAEELIAASRGGAQRFKGRMIEAMHVEEARITIERSQHGMDGT